MANQNPSAKSEADARVLIDHRLDALGWKTIWRESVPQEYKSKLGGTKPDYVLCYEGSQRPAAIVEAKRASRDLEKALRQGRVYAQKLGCPIIFASDGVLTMTAHVSDGKPLMINNEEVRDFLREGILTKFTHSRIWERKDVIKSSSQLISIFNAASKLLRTEGIANIDAFAEFSQILFFKIVSEQDAALPKRRLKIRWDDLEQCRGNSLLELYKAALRSLGKRYPGVFSPQIEIKTPATLEKIITRIKDYSFMGVQADIKGNAYEHFLRQYNRQKSELAQYFTPRHIVAMMVALSDPKLGETVYDPFCGTGGMLLEAFRHVETHMKGQSDADKKRLRESFFGNDISRSATAAKMNMILAGDGHSNISRCDSLSTPATGKYDVVITNIPFVPVYEKDFIRHCLSACAGHLGGRVCMIVPERILDHADYTDLRLEILREWTIRRVISLPREVFRGITSAKTSVLYAVWGGDYSAVKNRYLIPYVKIENDGYTLDRKRDPLPGRNDIDAVIEGRYANIGGHHADAKNGYAFKLPMDKEIGTKFRSVCLRELVNVRNEMINITADMLCKDVGMSGKEHKIVAKEERYGYNVKVRRRKMIRRGDLVFSRLHTQDGLFAFAEEILHGTGTHLVCMVDESKIDRHFLFYALAKAVPDLSIEDTTGRENYSEQDILNLKIPLPSLAQQRDAVRDLTAAQQEYMRATAEFESAKKVFWRKIYEY